VVHTELASDIHTLLHAEPSTNTAISFRVEQEKDPYLRDIIYFMESGHGVLPIDPTQARKIVVQQSLFTIIDSVLYFVDHIRDNIRRTAVPTHLRNTVLEEAHWGNMCGHFSGKCTFSLLVCHWWWENMYSDTMKFVSNCPECTITAGVSRYNNPPLHPIPVSRPFQIVGIDLMELPQTKKGNKHVVVMQDYLTKWPLVYPTSDQKAQTLARILAEDVIPFFRVPEALLSDRGTNLLSHLMTDL